MSPVDPAQRYQIQTRAVQPETLVRRAELAQVRGWGGSRYNIAFTGSNVSRGGVRIVFRIRCVAASTSRNADAQAGSQRHRQPNVSSFHSTWCSGTNAEGVRAMGLFKGYRLGRDSILNYSLHAPPLKDSTPPIIHFLKVVFELLHTDPKSEQLRSIKIRRRKIEDESNRAPNFSSLESFREMK